MKGSSSAESIEMLRVTSVELADSVVTFNAELLRIVRPDQDMPSKGQIFERVTSEYSIICPWLKYLSLVGGA